MSEIWKDIKGYEGFYQVSNLGNVRSVDRVVKHPRYGERKEKGRLLKPRKVSKNGRYLTVLLCKNGKQVNHRVHRLVAEAFIPNEYNKREVNHIDGNRENNRADNLEWVTREENMRHAFNTGLAKRETYIEANRPNMKRVYCSNGVTYESINAAARSLGLNTGGISSVINGSRNHCGGYTFQLVS